MHRDDKRSAMTDYPFQKILDAFPELYRICKCFECGKGWYDILFDLSNDIYTYCKKHGIRLGPEEIGSDIEDRGIYVTQVKEKYGTLRFYLSCSPKEIDDFVKKAQRKSEETCEVCGLEGKLYEERGWLQVRCREHGLPAEL